MLAIKYLIICGLLLTCLQLPQGCRKHYNKPQEEVLTTPAEESKTARSFSVLSEQARVALVLPCGRCHQSTLDTHKPGAVAIFDLDAGEAWHAGLDADKLSGLVRRVEGNSKLSEEERSQLALFVAQKRGRIP